MTDADQLSRRIATSTAVAWLLGVLLLAGLCVAIAHQGRDQDVDDRLTAMALAAYGLGYWDAEGVFHDELLLIERDLFEGDVQITIASPDETVFGPRFEGQEALVEQALETLEQVWVRQRHARTLAMATYDDNDVPVGAVIARVSTGPLRAASMRFNGAVAATALALVLIGLVVSRRISARVLAAFRANLDERERILAGAAHELRTPLATLLAVVESSEPERAVEALQEVGHTAAAAAAMVDRLLVWSRLARGELAREPVRLDLLVELCLEDDEPLEAEAAVVQADPRLVQVAVRNLVENARVHGGGGAGGRGAGGGGEGHDRGPGIADEGLLEPFCKGPDSPGTGLGLALVQRIAQRHGGRLLLAPVVTLELPVA